MSDADILAIVQNTPDIGTDNASHVNDLIALAKTFIVEYCKFDRFPALSQGYALSGSSATEDISSLAGNTFYISVDGSGFYVITLTLANCTTGANTAAEMQTQIRAKLATDHTFYHRFRAVTVAWDGTATQYTVTSPSYGDNSRIYLTHKNSDPYVDEALRLSDVYGGTTVFGAPENDDIERACARVVVQLYRQTNLAPEIYTKTTQFATSDVFQLLDSVTLGVLKTFRGMRIPSKTIQRQSASVLEVS